MILKYVDAFKNTYWILQDPTHFPAGDNRHYGMILKHNFVRKSRSHVSHPAWNIGDEISVSKSLCEPEESYIVLKEIFCGSR